MARRQVAALAADDVLWEQSPDEEGSSFSDDSFTGRDRPRWAEDYADEHDGPSTQPGELDEYTLCARQLLYLSHTGMA